LDKNPWTERVSQKRSFLSFPGRGARDKDAGGTEPRLLDQLREKDVIVVTKYDRLARSLRDLLDIVEVIKARGAGFRSLAEDIDRTTPAGRLVFHVFASIAQFECKCISEGTKEGLEAARKRGRVAPPPPRRRRPRPSRDRQALQGQHENSAAGLSFS